MNTNSNEHNELTPLLTQPTAITRRSFIKRTASAVLVTALALGAFRNEARADESSSSSLSEIFKWTLEIDEFGTPMVIMQRHPASPDDPNVPDPNVPDVILPSLPNPPGNPMVDIVPEEIGDDSNIYGNATGWQYSRADDLEVTEYVFLDYDDPNSVNFGDESHKKRLYRIILQARVVESYPQTSIQCLVPNPATGNKDFKEEVGFFATTFTFVWKIKVSVAVSDRTVIYIKDDPSGVWYAPNPDGVPGPISTPNVGNPAWNDLGWHVQTFDEVESSGSVTVDEDSGTLTLSPASASGYVTVTDEPLEKDDEITFRLRINTECDRFSATAELIVAEIDDQGSPIVPAENAVAETSAEISDGFSWQRVKYEVPRRC